MRENSGLCCLMAGGLFVRSVGVLITLVTNVENLRKRLRRYLGIIMIMMAGLPPSLGQP